MAEIAQPAQQRGVVGGRYIRFARDPRQQLAVGRLHQLLEFGHFIIGQLIDGGIGEADVPANFDTPLFRRLCDFSRNGGA